MNYDTNVTLDDLALNLSDAERKIADMLLAREYTPKKERPTYDEIAEELGVSVRQLYNIRHKPAFITYYRALSETRLATYHARVDAALMKVIEGGNNGLPSIKGIELFYKLTGRLSGDTTITFADDRTAKRLSDDQVADELKQLSATLRRVQ